MSCGPKVVGLAVSVAAAAMLAVGASAAVGGAATVSVRGSDYGSILSAPGGVVVYMFAPDRAGTSTCYGTCAREWHPFLTKGKPVAGAGIKASLLGTTTRRGGSVQVTYNGHPLYFDTMSGEAHTGSEIGCQHLDINGGIWLIVKPNGQPNMSKAKPHERR